ncbi:double-stranded RNA-binding protein Staufen homolog 2 isoform X1 [Ornithorhynchus anatinus]|uniref:Double-stranded RNA-binding protein Staufen homolog 2 n=1 Tax=Ornithorhynchus anatinus TaxID=9258 RepID=A0A6I8PLV2_ORNAN|nr:double-stranded RNA-binding protein Staufen homolog 2 isoform X1 [Ornithorhynchus anatinus]XP_039768429.1 double-stranded RNA-binding protein Staufen homolog 2 isoform X1 [Ornithorhynchus anatinus]
MAQVKMQASASLPGPLPAPPPSAPSPPGLPASVNGPAPEPATPRPGPAGGLGDPSPSSHSPAPLLESTANAKEKTPMCLVNELARFNRVQPLYKLLNERGPAHAKMFAVQLTLGEQLWAAEGSSIKKAQHAAATRALTETTLPKPTPRPPKNNVNNNPGSITPTVELNGLAMKRGEPAVYRPLDPKPASNYRANYNFRGMYNQRYHCPVPKIFYVQLTVGNDEFFGEGKTRQAARHNAAMKALRALQNKPIPEKSPQNGEAGRDTEEEKDANKSEISAVFEIALKHRMPVRFEVIKESGPPHMKSFVTRVAVGEFCGEGEGNSKKLSKKRAATVVLQELRKLPPLPAVEKPKPYFKKRPRTILKASPESGQGVNPISRLAQIQQARKEKEPNYVLLSERGLPRRREFLMQVKVGKEIATGTGPNKKIAKRNAAEAMLLHLGYRASTPRHDPADKPGDGKGRNGPKVGFPEPTSNAPKGILHLSPDVYQEMEASRHRAGPVPGAPPGGPAALARDPLLDGSPPAAGAAGLPGVPGPAARPAERLEYLAAIQGFQAALSALKQFSEQGLDPVEGAPKMGNGSLEKAAKHPGEKADGEQGDPGPVARHREDPKPVTATSPL